MIVELFDKVVRGISELSINSKQSFLIETLAGIRVDYLRYTNSWLRGVQRYSLSKLAARPHLTRASTYLERIPNLVLRISITQKLLDSSNNRNFLLIE